MIEKNNLVIQDNIIKDRIFTIRNIQVMIDRDLAEFYGIETKVFNQAVKRNIARFPEDFRFQLNDIEKNELVTNCDRFKMLKHSTTNPYVFTEYSLKDTKKPISISTYEVMETLPKELEAFLPSSEEIANRLSQFDIEDSINDV